MTDEKKKPLEGWALIENRQNKVLTEAEKEEAVNQENLFNIDLAKTFASETGKRVLERWKRTTVERRLDLVLINPTTGQRYPNPDQAIFARIGEDNFIKDILTRIERAKSG